MNYMKRLYRNHEKIWCSVIFPLILLLYPLVMVNQGVDVSDSTYSLTNFLHFESLKGMWVISTWLANWTGWLLLRLPYAATLLGINVYTSLIISALALLVYSHLRKWMPAWIAFAGEFIAIGFLWIPSTILYNYLTYFLFTLGTILLYKGLVEEKDFHLFLAGLALGLNVFVRIPNLTQMALILGVWYYLGAGGKPFSYIAKKTGVCIAGYALGVFLPLCGVLGQYGVLGLTEAITGLAAIQHTDASYSPLAMVASVVKAYFRSGKWLMILGIPTAFGMGMFALKKGRYETGKKILFLAGIPVILRFLWGRGMFSFRYYEAYTSMFEWGMMGLFLSWLAAAYMLGSAKTSREEKLMAVFTMIILAVTPLGSNNYTYQNLNNLFLAAPFTLYTFVKLYRFRKGSGPLSGLAFCWKAMAAAIGAMILIQATGFHLNFTFRDGTDGTARDYSPMEPETLAGMKTTRGKGEALEGLYSWLNYEGKLIGYPVICYGDCPGLYFLFKLYMALDTAWPDLDSYPYDHFVSGLEGMDKKAVVIVRRQEPHSGQSIQKKEYLAEWMERNSYICGYENTEYAVYLPKEVYVLHGVEDWNVE